MVGGGKAAAAMARAVVEVLSPALTPSPTSAAALSLTGHVVTKYGHLESRFGSTIVDTNNAEATVTVAEAAHPVPDEAGVSATTTMLRCALPACHRVNLQRAPNTRRLV